MVIIERPSVGLHTFFNRRGRDDEKDERGKRRRMLRNGI